ncbi:uncharacterized protein LOC110667123 isoform X5 [Hevea brasiliensis]|uniref:uncharacterized protein LOC110667123 isoform X5 n=1 Tax=Hevea brasiliensis TaxID=3981 RepID=UPI0025D62FFE|nr:uncharacterized protein LOC110667123 isoform X5 [Hevea brasiliensis]
MMGVSVCSWPPSLLPRSPPSLKRFGVYSSSSPQSLCPTRETTLSIIHNSGVIACLRANSAELAFEAASAALRGGISVLEIVMSTPGVFQVLQQLVQDHPTVALGVGTLLNVEDAMKAKSAGAKFLMSPAMVMVYPVSALGGIHFISALKKPFPHISVLASQGIMIDSVRDYISCGASSVVLSDAIFNKEAMAQKNFNAIYQLASLAALQGKEAVLRKRNYNPN